ncbi:MAG: hypothetical protein MB54_02905 [marine actinobacterium MedAcidi-G2B]|nr:MAG: hypothetical protein MB54_02905 [marine actinobacterium MedAcidi-G2B]MDC0245646.1 hypothetical protein [Acidimicrobiaceae bacterium]
MHDISNLEKDGLPGVFVASLPFIDAAETQSKAVGINVSRIFVDHPIQDRTDVEMIELADSAFDDLVKALTQ